MSLETEIAALTHAVKVLTDAIIASPKFIAPTPSADPVVMTYKVEEVAVPAPAPEPERMPAVVAGPAPAAAPAEPTPIAPAVTRDELRELAKLKMTPAGMSAKVKQAVQDFGVASITACPDDKLAGLKKVLEAL